jgi:nitronate monooxygenase
MGAGVSSWRLARAVSQSGQLGVVSGTALDVILARRLQQGDLSGECRSAFEQFPIPGVADRVLRQYYIEEGKAATQPFRSISLPSIRPSAASVELTILANFTEVLLAKRGHQGVVGINYLHKIQLPTLPSLFGAMLAGVDYVLMGAGIPMAIPEILDQLARGEPVELNIEVEGAGPDEEFNSQFDPRLFLTNAGELKRPFFLPIISSTVLALTLARKASGRVDGFVVEGDLAGGHNAPPRGMKQLSDRGEPIYGPRDAPDLEKIRSLGLPFWLAGSYATPARLADALKTGATGIQVGTAFAFCEESGIDPIFKAAVIQAISEGKLDIFTDPLASPTGFPFKVARLAGTISEATVYAARERGCDLGYLRQAYRKADGTVGYRCPAELEINYVAKGGALADTIGRKCVCNGLLSTIGLGQVLADNAIEPAMITAGNDATSLGRLFSQGQASYTANDVIAYLLQKPS